MPRSANDVSFALLSIECAQLLLFMTPPGFPSRHLLSLSTPRPQRSPAATTRQPSPPAPAAARAEAGAPGPNRPATPPPSAHQPPVTTPASAHRPTAATARASAAAARRAAWRVSGESASARERERTSRGTSDSSAARSASLLAPYGFETASACSAGKPSCSSSRAKSCSSQLWEAALRERWQERRALAHPRRRAGSLGRRWRRRRLLRRRRGATPSHSPSPRRTAAQAAR